MHAMQKAQPVLDFRALLSLDADDTLEGYRLCLGGFIHVNLEGIEKAYLEADAAGLHAGVLVQFNYGSTQLAVVTGRNLTVCSNIGTPSRYPVEIQSTRGHFEYSTNDATPVPTGTPAVVLLKNAEFLEGPVEAAGLTDEGLAFVQVNGQKLLFDDIAVFERAPVLQ